MSRLPSDVFPAERLFFRNQLKLTANLPKTLVPGDQEEPPAVA
jgi:hypothetical protein